MTAEKKTPWVIWTGAALSCLVVWLAFFGLPDRLYADAPTVFLTKNEVMSQEVTTLAEDKDFKELQYVQSVTFVSKDPEDSESRDSKVFTTAKSGKTFEKSYSLYPQDGQIKRWAIVRNKDNPNQWDAYTDGSEYRVEKTKKYTYERLTEIYVGMVYQVESEQSWKNAINAMEKSE